MKSDAMSLFHIDLLRQLVKRAVDKADLESLGPSPSTDFEAREITEHLCKGDGGDAK